MISHAKKMKNPNQSFSKVESLLLAGVIRQCLPCNFLDVHAELGKAFANLPFPMIVFFTRQKRYLDCGWCVLQRSKDSIPRDAHVAQARAIKHNEAEIYCNYCIHYPQLQAVKSQGCILREGLKESFPKLSWKKIGQACGVVPRCCESRLKN